MMRIATYNIEWFADLFDQNDRLLDDDEWSGRRDVRRGEQIEAIAKVLVAINADVLLVVEAPNTGKRQSSVRALENFARSFGLRTSRALGGFASDTQQEITLLFDPKTCRARHDPVGTLDESGTESDDSGAQGLAPRFDGVFHIDLDVDRVNETIRFSKPPLEVRLSPKGRRPVRLIGVHVKSKAPHGARDLKEQIRISIDNRRKQLAQCIWIRARVDYHLTRGDPLIVLGDFNDGPGLDEYEHLFGHSGIEVVLGVGGPPERMLYDPNAAAALAPRPSAHPATSRFYIAAQRRYLNALLDYIMVSPDLREKAVRWHIWHPFDNPDCYGDPELRTALLTASDHFPVTLDIHL